MLCENGDDEENNINYSKKDNDKIKCNTLEDKKDDIGNEEMKFKIEKYECKHGCNHIFRTKRQKILHHDKLDNICHEEKMNLLLLIEIFEDSINKLIPRELERRKYIEYTVLLKQIARVKKKAIDTIQMKGFLKENW